MKQSVPEATRSRGANWRDPRLVIGLAVVALSVLAGGWLMASVDDTVGVWAVRRNLPAGATPGAADLEARQVRFGDAALADRYLSADEALPSGTVLGREATAGELLPRDALVERSDEDLTEVPLSVAIDDLPATVEVGSTVDVWVAAQAGQAAADADGAQLVLKNVSVVRLPGPDSTLGGTGTRQVIVATSLKDSDADLAAAIGQIAEGRVVLTRER